MCQGPRVGPTNAPRRAVPRGRSRKALPSEPGSACVRGHNRAAQPERLRGHTFILARPGGRTSEMQARAGLVPAEPLSWACGRVPSPRLYPVDPLRVSLKTLSPKLVPNASRGCGARPVNVERHSSAQQKRCRFSTKWKQNKQFLTHGTRSAPPKTNSWWTQYSKDTRHVGAETVHVHISPDTAGSVRVNLHDEASCVVTRKPGSKTNVRSPQS